MLDYELHELLGKGSYGSVYRAVSRLNKQTCAIKVVHVGHATCAQTRLYVLNEIRILATHVCAFIVIFKEAYVHDQDLHICTEFASHGDLNELIKKHANKNTHMSENCVWCLFLQTAIAVDYLHKLNVIHRDIKPANILLDTNDNVKLADVGIVKIMRSHIGCGQTQIGTPLYMAPEILRRERYGVKSDVWALGCVFYEIMYLKPAFYTTSMFALRNNILAGKFGQIKNGLYSNYTHVVLHALIKVSTRQRWCLSIALTQPEIVKLLTERGLERAPCNPRVKPLFYKAIAPPRRMEDWRVLTEMFCSLNHTIQLSDSMAHEIEIVNNLRKHLEVRHDALPRLASYRAIRSARVMPNVIQVNKRAQIAEHERKIVQLRKEIAQCEQAIIRLKRS